MRLLPGRVTVKRAIKRTAGLASTWLRPFVGHPSGPRVCILVYHRVAPLRFIDPDVDNNSKADEGIFAKLAFWRSKDDKVPTKMQYRISVREQQPGGPTNVIVLAPGNQADVSPIARQILDLLLQQLR